MDKAQVLRNLLTVTINGKFDELPSEQDFMAEALALRKVVDVSEAEFQGAVRSVQEAMQVSMDTGVLIEDPGSRHVSWVPSRRATMDLYYWDRYRRYLESEKGWNTRILSTLDIVSDEILDHLGDPIKAEPWQRRGLVLGDVQSGKTANYAALCNKAADAGYKVVIVLTGIMETLRRQTQERLDLEFAGRKSQGVLLPPRGAERPRVHTVFAGVGRMDGTRSAAVFTSVLYDFNKAILNTNSLTLRNVTEPALFVVKKNKRVLHALESWLWKNNADAAGKIDLPLLLIDDEADNASVNTRKSSEEPTAINAAVRSILNRFYRASYVGVTATPFANIFINPETSDDMVGDDLFPRDFIYLLAPPSNYIGADAVFGRDGGFAHVLEPLDISDVEAVLPANHRRTLKVSELPTSLEESLCYFCLVNVVRDIRGDQREHRSMLVNVSRFTDVQLELRELVNEWLVRTRVDVKNYATMPSVQADRLGSLRHLRDAWEKFNLAEKAGGIAWGEVRSRLLYEAMAPIEVRAVNQSTGASSLDYSEHPDGFRVIVIGGNSLSRGITLEGLCVSYFYRKSRMYDTLLQMGRWFGYRPNYEDLVKIWIGNEAIDCYGYVTEAVGELKSEIGKMNRLRMTPKDFGLKVRQDPNSLIATARNKMLSAQVVKRPVTVAGRLLETPRLKSDRGILDGNERALRMFVGEIGRVVQPESKWRGSWIWAAIPRLQVSRFVRSFDTHPWHLAFQASALADYIDDSADLDQWDVVMAAGSGSEVELQSGDTVIAVHTELRRIIIDQDMLLVSGKKLRVGSGGATKVGLDPMQIERAETDFFRDNPEKQDAPDSAYLIQGRRPLLMLHAIECSPPDGSLPDVVYAIGLGFPRADGPERTATYVVNLVEFRNMDEYEESDDPDDEEVSEDGISR